MVDWKVPETKHNGWVEVLFHHLQLFGHRNWICVVDAAYPLQIAPGIEMVNTGAAIETVLPKVAGILSEALHVQPIAYIDAEMPMVAEEDAPGISLYRTNLETLLADFATIRLDHEAIIERLARAATEFQVLILKTRLNIPYTSVFFELECGYWTAASETRLRNAIARDASHDRVK